MFSVISACSQSTPAFELLHSTWVRNPCFVTISPKSTGASLRLTAWSIPSTLVHSCVFYVPEEMPSVTKKAKEQQHWHILSLQALGWFVHKQLLPQTMLYNLGLSATANEQFVPVLQPGLCLPYSRISNLRMLLKCFPYWMHLHLRTLYHLDKWRSSSKWLERHMEEIYIESTLIYLFAGLDEESLLRVEIEKREKRVVNTWLFLYSFLSSKIHLLPVLNWVPFWDRQSASLLGEMNSEKHLAIYAHANELLIKCPWQCFYCNGKCQGLLMAFYCFFLALFPATTELTAEACDCQESSPRKQRNLLLNPA